MHSTTPPPGGVVVSGTAPSSLQSLCSHKIRKLPTLYPGHGQLVAGARASSVASPCFTMEIRAMKRLLILAIAVSVSAPLLAAPVAQDGVPSTKVHKETHAGGFYQDVVVRSQPAVPQEPEKEHKAVVATTECAPLWGGGKSDEQPQQARNTAGIEEENRDGAAIVPVPDGCAGLGLSRPLYGNMSVGAAVGIGAAIVAVGAAIGNHGGGGHHSSSGTTGTTK